ncbi:uncharacterized protein L199_008436 [Kwoniella botswanensis]|uniref:uncharacterized protein n=1 Tax=Kwoniella botswanensis TaxID=1268659 RepID=UPI00315C72E4
MLSIRTAAARQSVSQLGRTTSLLPIDIPFPHAECSSAPSRRSYASSSAATALAPNEDVERPSTLPVADSHHDRVSSVKKEKRQFRGNPRLRKQALANARKLNEAIQSEKINTSTITPPTSPSTSAMPDHPSEKEDSSFWSDLLTRPSASSKEADSPGGSAPTLEDLLAKKPARPPPDPYHPKYPKLYQKLIDDLDNAFVQRQLKFFCRQLNLYTNSKTSKIGFIKKILKTWGWVEPKDERTDMKKPHVYDLPPAELFLFLRENDLIHEMTKGYERMELAVVPLSEAPQTPFSPTTAGDPNRMVLVAVGRVGPLVKLTNLIQERKKAIQTIEISAQELDGFKAPVGLLQTVSNATGAYVEPLSDDKYRITAMSVEDAENAKRLLTMASLRINSLPSHRSLDVLLPTPRHFQTQPLRLSLYPFIPSISESLPWSIASNSNSQALFRLKKVTEWNSKPAIREIDHKNEKLHLANYMNLSTPISTSKSEGNVEKAEIGENESVIDKEGENHFQNLISSLGAKKGKKRLKVIFGNLLFTRQGKLAIFDNPLPGQWPIETLKNWLSRSSKDVGGESKKPLFTPSLTPSMIQFPFLTDQTSEIRRIRYRSLPTSSPAGESRFVEFTYAKPNATTEQNNWQDRLGAMLDDLEKQIEQEDGAAPSQSLEASEQDERTRDNSITSSGELREGALADVSEENAVKEEDSERPFDAVFGVIRESDLFIPDRPNDARIVSTSTVSLPTSKIPESIVNLFDQQPYQDKMSLKLTSPPSKVMIKDEEYLLEYDEKVELTEEIQEIPIGGNVLILVKRSCKVVENGLEDLNPLTYSELECGSNSDGTLPIEFYREFAHMTRDVGPDAGALKRGNILSGLGAGLGGWHGMVHQ